MKATKISVFLVLVMVTVTAWSFPSGAVGEGGGEGIILDDFSLESPTKDQSGKAEITAVFHFRSNFPDAVTKKKIKAFRFQWSGERPGRTCKSNTWRRYGPSEVKNIIVAEGTLRVSIPAETYFDDYTVMCYVEWGDSPFALLRSNTVATKHHNSKK